MLSVPEGYEQFDQIYCGDTKIGDAGELVYDIPPHSPKEIEVRFISTRHPVWMEADGTVPENCPRNPEFDTSKELGCFSCAQSNIVFDEGNTVLANMRSFRERV